MRTELVLTLIVLLAGCHGERVTLRGDDGRSSLSYRCDDPGSELADTQSVKVIADYALRLARQSAEAADTMALRELMALYADNDWPALERNAVRQACQEGPLEPPELAFPTPGAPAPDFELAYLNQPGALKLTELRGRVVVVDFWATWCKPCIEQMPELDRLAQQYPKALAVVAVLHKDAPSRARAWLSDNPTKSVVHVVGSGQQLAAAYKVWGLPATYVLSASGAALPSVEHSRRRMPVTELERYLQDQRQ